MQKILDEIVLNNSIRSYLIVFGFIFIMLLAGKYLSRMLAMFIHKIFMRKVRDFDKTAFINLLAAPLKFFLIVVVILTAFDQLNFPNEFKHQIFKLSTQTIFESLGIIVFFISFTWLALRMIDYLAFVLEKRAQKTHDQTDNQLILFFKDFFKVMVAVTGIVLIIRFAFHQSVTSLITGLSIAGAAIALATRESLENLIASFIIFFDKPFSIGDLIKVQNITGTIEKIGLRSTRIRTEQKTFVTVPNKQMVDSILDNLSLRTQRKIELRLDLNASIPSDILMKFKNETEIILTSKFSQQIESFTILFNDMNKDAFVMLIEVFTPPYLISEFNTLKENINFNVLALMEKYEIKLAGKASEIIIQK